MFWWKRHLLLCDVFWRDPANSIIPYIKFVFLVNLGVIWSGTESELDEVRGHLQYILPKTSHRADWNSIRTTLPALN
ncbi:hypothetical protein N7495_003425 [Penicillium taxi]|uniref:uncharacterized protein n=1 Tax=Penicillium taxi TaxID=168475 RepID=UPI0025456372|nr:uncharacterized protein N7495_003425 [Penicillium taxi]KAJ5902897.1 hypothetical protein N7495_003425 [Penicillium taxi]